MNNQSDDERRAADGQYRKTIWKMLGMSAVSGLGGGTPVVRHPDERVAATSQHWAAIGGSFMSIALGIDVMVRVLILNQDYHQWWEIFLIWMANLFLVGIGQIRSGVRPVGAGGKWSWRTSGLMVVMLALMIPAGLWCLGELHSLPSFAAMVAFSALGALVMQLIMRGIYSRWERRNLGPDSGEE